MQALIDKIDFSYKLVGDDFDGKEGQSHWSVTIGLNGSTYTTKYSMGCAHRHYPKTTYRKYEEPIVRKTPIDLYSRLSVHELEKRKKSKPNEPELLDVLFSLCMDASSADCHTFEDFCSEFDYSDDSISAKKIYDACLEVYVVMGRMGIDIYELNEFLQEKGF